MNDPLISHMVFITLVSQTIHCCIHSNLYCVSNQIVRTSKQDIFFINIHYYLQLNFRENLSMVPRLSSTSPVSEVSDEDNASPMHMDGGRAGKDSRRRSKKPVPDEKKDETYWRRRHKNNLAAKRSREARRQKETDLTKKATLLEMEHDKLK